MAPTRSGKGVGTIIPNLLLDRSAICIDPKGENVRVTARVRAAKGKVWCLDPFGVSGQPPAHYNPLDRLDPASLDLAKDANTLCPTRWCMTRRDNRAKPTEARKPRR